MLISRFGFRTFIAGAACLWLAACSALAPAPSAKRLFQMSILSSTDNVYNAGVDIPTFARHTFYNYQAQPEEMSIAWLPPGPDLDRHDVDWQRIVAVLVDEPYGEALKGKDSCADPSIKQTIDDTMAALAAMAAAVRERAPKARFWVNFTQREIDLMRTPAARCPLNQPYIDVISMDIYGVDFAPEVSRRYNDLYQHHRATPHQQLALVPGTFTLGWEKQTGAQGASRLAGYFEFAGAMNRKCNLPLGPTGHTGYDDGCPVWIVAGWMGGVAPLHYEPRDYLPMDNPNSILLFNAWQAQFAVPRASLQAP